MRHTFFPLILSLSLFACGSSESPGSEDASLDDSTGGYSQDSEDVTTSGASSSSTSFESHSATYDPSDPFDSSSTTSGGSSGSSSDDGSEDSSTGSPAAPQLCVNVDHPDGHFYVRAKNQAQVLWSTDPLYAKTDADASGDCSTLDGVKHCCHEEMFIGGTKFVSELDLSFAPVEGYITPESRDVFYDGLESVGVDAVYEPAA